MPLDIARIAAAALAHAETLVPQWLPAGKRVGGEWVVGDLDGSAGESCSINLRSGAWSDFASGEAGGDLVSLYAAIHNMRQSKAARELARELGMSEADPPPPPPKRRTEWVPVLPVPADAGDPPVAHVVRGKPERVWRYHDQAGRLLGLVYRFVTSDGGKEVLPVTYARHPNGKCKWSWLSFVDPRPLYGLDRLRDGMPVLVVEGEKCADAAHGELATWFDIVAWPGGGKAVQKADWAPLAGRDVLLWPDCDAEADKNTGEILPADRQAGVRTMAKLAGILAEVASCVRTIQIPPAGSVADGWDVADAIHDGLHGPELLAWINAHCPPNTPPPPPNPPRTPPPAGGEGSDRWQDELIYGPRNALVDCRENVMLTLIHHPDWRGRLGFNAFAGRTESLDATPWRTGPGEWTTRDDRELGLWLAKRIDLLIRSEANLSAGVEMAAERQTFHPVMAYLDALTWDGVDRLSHWLQDCCGVDDTPYTRLAGMYFLRAMVARVWKPGAQVDHMLVLEGGQGRGKSTALRILGGEWYSDTQFRLGDKDALLQLVDVWLYEVSELDAFSRADVTAVKQFLTTLNDNIRGVYERRARKRPRQVVIAGTTNQERYLRDMTGNRRFWPVKVGEMVDTDKLRAWRDQLFAQAYQEIRAGERWWPTREEERLHFQAAQEARTITDPWLDELPKRLDDIKWSDRKTFTTAELLGALGVSADKIDSQGQMARRIETIMHTLAWTRTRERRTDGTRPHVYVRPTTAADDAGEVPL
jgi:putative DNA primase/helicase